MYMAVIELLNTYNYSTLSSYEGYTNFFWSLFKLIKELLDLLYENFNIPRYIYSGKA